MQRVKILTATLSLLLLTVPAMAQSGRGGFQRQTLDSERAWAAWELEADGVAHRLGLSDEASHQLTKAYMSARSGYAKELEAMRGGRERDRAGRGEGGERRERAGRGVAGEGAGKGAGEGAGKGAGKGAGEHAGGGEGDTGGNEHAGRGEGRGERGEARGEGRERGGRGDDTRGERSRGRGGMNREAIMELRESQTATLKAALTPIVPAESLEPTLAVLGSFNNQWDTLVDTLAGFELDDEKKYAALDAVETYVGVFGSMRRGARARGSGGGSGGFDREEMMEKFRSSTENLNETLGNILTEEQMKKMSKHLRMRRGNRRAPRELDT